MKKISALLMITLMLCFQKSEAQNYWKEFNELLPKMDNDAIETLLKNWEAKDNNDPQLYVANFNYYFKKSRKDVVTLGQNPKGGEVLTLMNQDTSVKEPAGYMYSDIYYDPDLLKKCYNYIDRGIEKFPDRLDMRFGKIHTYGVTKDYEMFTTELIKTINLNASGKYKWKWIEGKPLDDPKEYFTSSVQGYVMQLYDTEDDALLDNMKRISDAMLKHNPNHVESLSNISIVFMLKGKYNEGLDALLKAEKVAPEDYIVLSNIAHAYILKEDYKNAIKYYELVIKYGDDKTKAYAKNKIEELKKK